MCFRNPVAAQGLSGNMLPAKEKRRSGNRHSCVVRLNLGRLRRRRDYGMA
jgi:hypothetical protein